MVRPNPNETSPATKALPTRTPKSRRVRDSRKRSGRFRFVPQVVVFAAIPLLLAPGPIRRADAYRFYPLRGAGYIVEAAEATRWSRQVWGPGDTLVYSVVDMPEWSHWYGSATEVLPRFQRALEAWSDIPSADISWRMGEVTTWDAARESGGYASIRGRGTRITSCPVHLGSWAAREPPDRWHELDEDDPWRTHPGFGTMIHEFGHCLGLRHSVELPGLAGLTVRYRYDAEGDRYGHAWVHSADVSPRDPQMSYGWSDYGLEYPVTQDDIVGASLLRPAGNWREGTGSIAGQVLLDGEPLGYAHVWAFGDGSTRGLPNAVGSFGARDGSFRIEGLAPGVYSLWVSSMGSRSAHVDLVGRGSLIDLAETLRPFPVVVTAGQTTEGVQVHATRGRDCQRPAPCGPR